jgi:drug/metabolite transporter (DMT)-like permease
VPKGRALAAGALLAVHWTAMFAGYQHAPADTVVFVVFLAPVGIAALAPRLLGERLDVRTIGALGLAVAGFVLVAGPALEPGTATGLAWAGLSAATFVGLVLVSKSLAPTLGGLRLNLLEMTVAGILLLPVAAASDWTGLATAWPWLLVLGAVHTALGITLYLAALARVPAAHVGILGYVEPVSVVVLSWLVLGDRPAPTTLAGGVLVLAAGAAVVLPATRVRQTTDADADPSPVPEVPAHVPG